MKAVESIAVLQPDPDTAVPMAAAPRWRSRVGTSFWSLTDQGVVSLGNFLTMWLLGRNLSQADFGIYGVVLGVMLFFNNIQGSLVNYPLSVHGAICSGEKLRQLTWMSLLLTAALLLPMTLGIAGVATAMKMLDVAPWVVAALVLWQFQETMRRALMSQLRYRDAIWGDAISYLGQAAVVAFLIRRGQVRPPQVFAAMALTSALAAVVQGMQIRPQAAPGSEVVRRAYDCWELGRWTALSNLAGVVNIQVVLWTLAAAHGAVEAAKLLALGTILGVTHPALFSVGNLIVPAAAREHGAHGPAAAKRVAWVYGTIGGMLVIPYYVLLAIRPELALRIFYKASSPYMLLGTPLRLFAAAYLISYLCTVQSALLNAMARSRSALLIQLAMVGGTLAITLPLAVVGGVMWSLAGACTSTLAGLVVGSALLRGSAPVSQEESFVTDDAASFPAAA